MYVIHFVVDNQRIYLKDPIQQVLVANSVGYLYCDFIFLNEKDWVGLDRKISFSWGAKTETRKFTGEPIEIPYQIIQTPGFTVSIKGEIYENGEIKTRLTTSPFPIKITPSGDLFTPEKEDNFVDGGTDAYQVAKTALEEAKNAKKVADGAAEEVDAYFEIICDLQNDTQKLQWIAESYENFSYDTTAEINVLKNKTNSLYEDLELAKEKINGLTNSLTVAEGDIEALRAKAQGISDDISSLFDTTKLLEENDSKITEELKGLIDEKYLAVLNDLESLDNELTEKWQKDIEDSNAILQALLQGQYDTFVSQIDEKVFDIENLFTLFSSEKDFLNGRVTNLSTYIGTTVAGLNSSISNLFSNYETISSDLDLAKEELSAAVDDAKKELEDIIDQLETATQGSFKDVTDTVLGDLELPQTTSITFENFEISEDSSDWGSLKDFNELGTWIDEWLLKHNEGLLKYLLNVAYIHTTTVSLAQDIQRVRNHLGELSEDLSNAQDQLYGYTDVSGGEVDGDIDKIAKNIATLQNSIMTEAENRETQDASLVSAINENKEAISTLQDNGVKINSDLLVTKASLNDLEEKHNIFETTTQASFEEIKTYIDIQINAQVGAIITSDY